MTSTAAQIAVFAGGLVGLGLTMLIARLLPAQVDSKWAIEHLDPVRETTTSVETQRVHGLQNRVGLLIQRKAPQDILSRVPHRELALLQRPVHVYFGEKGLLFFLGLLTPPLMSWAAGVLGMSLPITMPLIGSLIVAVVFWLLPDLRIRGEAKKARGEFVRALATYIDLVALERASGAGTRQALENAAQVGDSWVFKRIKAAIDQAEWVGQSPWDGLKELSEELSVTELADLAEIMRLSREESATVYKQLRAKASSMRNGLLSDDLEKANEASEHMSVPVALLAMIFLIILIVPSFLRFMGS